MDHEWERSFPPDERSKTFTTRIDGFDLKVKGVESFVLDQSIERYEVMLSLNGTLIGPICLTGDKAKQIFKALENT